MVFLAMYNPMIYESSFGVLSVHKTRKGAEMAMEFHREEMFKEYEADMKESKERGDPFDYGPFGQFEAWMVFEYKLEK